MSVSSGAALAETGINARSGCYYAIYTDTTELAKTVVGPSNFTGINNTTFNAELTFDVTDAFDGNVALYAWNSSTGGYRPGLNLIEIEKNSNYMAILQSTGIREASLFPSKTGNKVVNSIGKTIDEYTENFISGFAGHGWKLWEYISGKYKLEIDALMVRGTFTVFELQCKK